MDDAQIKHMVNRFLNWKLPENWKPDGGVTFEKYGNKDTPHQYTRNPVGTNLLDADQADAMVRYMIEGSPADRAYLGLATTRELLDEIRARIEIHATGGLDYRTVDGEKFATKAA